MARIISNWKDEHNGISVFRDFDDDAVLHYGPKLSWLPLNKQSLGQSITIFQGEIILNLSQRERDDLSTRFPQKRLVPLVPNSAIIEILPSIKIHEPHSITFEVIHNHPFPKFSFNATIRHSDADHDALISAIIDSWHNKTILSGKVSLGFEMFEVLVAKMIEMDRREIRERLSSNLKGSNWSLVESLTAIDQVVKQDSNNWIRVITPSTDSKLENNVHAYIVERIFKNYFVNEGHLITFDQGLGPEAWHLRNVLELHEKEKFLISKSNRVQVKMSLLD